MTTTFTATQLAEMKALGEQCTANTERILLLLRLNNAAPASD